MARSSRRRKFEEEDRPLAVAGSRLLKLVCRNPVAVGGSTAFLVALTFVSANALWYQPHAHSGAFFATRDHAVSLPPKPLPDATILIERESEAAEARTVGDPQVREVQAILKSLAFYDGEVDGLAGPNTRKAIADYQLKMGLETTGVVDAGLLIQLGASPSTSGIVPSPAPRRMASATTADTATDASPDMMPLPPDRLVIKVQAGLKAFGNPDMEVDGILGARTRAALNEFQALFGLPQTGEPDEAVYAKMREIGLTN